MIPASAGGQAPLLPSRPGPASRGRNVAAVAPADPGIAASSFTSARPGQSRIGVAPN